MRRRATVNQPAASRRTTLVVSVLALLLVSILPRTYAQDRTAEQLVVEPATVADQPSTNNKPAAGEDKQPAADDDKKPAATKEPATKKPPAKEPPTKSSDHFDPSEEISKDLSVSFPVDI